MDEFPDPCSHQSNHQGSVALEPLSGAIVVRLVTFGNQVTVVFDDHVEDPVVVLAHQELVVNGCAVVLVSCAFVEDTVVTLFEAVVVVMVGTGIIADVFVPCCLISTQIIFDDEPLEDTSVLLSLTLIFTSKSRYISIINTLSPVVFVCLLTFALNLNHCL